MLYKSANYLGLLLLLLMSYLAYLGSQPTNVVVDDVIEGNFHIENAFKHVEKIAQVPHFVGSDGHAQVKTYIVEQLQQLGLQVEVQSTNGISSRNLFTHVENIIAKIPGSDSNGKALLLMSHYDSAAPASRGAADAGSGVATILEGVRAYLADNITPKNDVIILITDGEELGLVGATAFVNQHPWANNIAAVLNFEARGSAGPSYMLIETNQGNSKLLDAYKQANPTYTTSDSLSYSIYKSLPNDTDLTVFRSGKDVVGFNFAFIDDHFNYHTARDSAQNLSLDSLAHQGHYLMPLLRTFSQIDLSTLQSDLDDVFFQIPFITTIAYPFSITLGLSLLNLVIFAAVLIVGINKGTLSLKSIFLGLVPLSVSLLSTGLLSYVILTVLYWLHPHYAEVLQGFTYNGHAYIVFFALLAINLCYFSYRPWLKKYSASNMLVAPTLVWLLLSLAASQWLSGAHFLILFGSAGTLILLLGLIYNKAQPIVSALLFALLVLIFYSFVMLPVALGLHVLPYNGVLLVLMLSVFIACFLVPEAKPISRWVLLAPLLGSLVYAESTSCNSEQQPLPNSLFYLQDQSSNTAFWLSYDKNTDSWNEAYLSQNVLTADKLATFQQQNLLWATTVSETQNRQIPAAKIDVLIDEQRGDSHYYQLKIRPQRPLNRIKVINQKTINVRKLTINNQVAYQGAGQRIDSNNSLCHIIPTNEQSFTLEIEIKQGENLNLNVLEFSFDLLSSPEFDIAPRPKEFISKPFINSDSIITTQNIVL